MRNECVSLARFTKDDVDYAVPEYSHKRVNCAGEVQRKERSLPPVDFLSDRQELREYYDALDE